MAIDLRALAEQVAGWANPGEELEVFAARSTDTEVRAYDGELESLSSATSEGIGLRVVVDHRQGFAYSGSLDVDLAKEALDAARDNAAFATPDEHTGLVEPDGVDPPHLDLHDAGLAAVDPAAKVDLALDLEAAVRSADRRIAGVEVAEYGDADEEVAIVTTTGITRHHRSTTCWLSADALAVDGDETQTGFGWSVGRRPGDLDLDVAARDTARRATQMLGAAKPPTGRLTVVLEPFVTAQFLAVAASTLAGDAVLKGYSPFAHRMGDQVAAAAITLVDDPTDPRSITAAPTDAEGLASRRNVLIGDGVLRQFAHDGYSGRRAGSHSNASAVRGGFASTPAPGCRALQVVPGTASQEELLAQVGEGVLIRSVSGLHSGVNPVSGDFSTGAEGLAITGGELGPPWREFTIASTLQRMLLDVVAVGADLEFLPMSASGVSLVVQGVALSGT